MRDLQMLALYLCVLLAVPNIGFAQLDRRLTLNGDFDAGLSAWNDATVPVEVRQRGWRPSFTIPFETYLGTNYAVAQGSTDGYVGQIHELPSDSKYQVLNAHAFKIASDGQDDGGYACLAVSYYDEFWNEIDQVTLDIEGNNNGSVRGAGDGMNFYSYGIVPPNHAKYFFMFVYTTTGTDVWFDRFILFDYANANSLGGPVRESIVVNGEFRIRNLGLNGVQSYNNEFWNSSYSPARDMTFYRGTFGAPDQDEWSYQFVPIDAKKSYVFEVQGDGTKSASASVGVDFYDSQWNYIGKNSVNFARKGRIEDYRLLNAPAGTAFASVYCYCAQVAPGLEDDMRVSSVELRPIGNRGSSASNAMVTETYEAAQKAGPTMRGVTMAISDRDGLELSSISEQDFFFRSASDPTTRYPVANFSVTAYSADKLAIVKFTSGATSSSLIGDVVIERQSISDKLGNLMNGRLFSFE